MMEEKANPVITALQEHKNALGPGQHKLIQAVNEHTPQGSEIQRRSSLLSTGNQPQMLIQDQR